MRSSKDLFDTIASRYPGFLDSLGVTDGVVSDIRYTELATDADKAAIQAVINAFDWNAPPPDITGFFQALGDAISLGTLPADFYLLSQIIKDQPDLNRQQILLQRFASNPAYTPELKGALNALMATYHLQLPPV